MDIRLDQIAWKATSHPGIFLHGLYRDEERGDAVVLIRMDPGCGYPAHRHVGEERVLVLHGAYRDESGVHRTGDRTVHPPGSFHSPVALDEGDGCVLLATAVGGIEIGTR